MTQKYKNLLKSEKSTGDIINLSWRINRECHDSISLVCRGNRMKLWEGFSNEVSAVLQFPDYFSGGFDSLYECIRDLEWIYRNRIFVFILDSNLILSEQNHEFLMLFDDSSKEVPPYSEKWCDMKKHVYYIFQNIDKDFPLFEDKELSEYK